MVPPAPAGLRLVGDAEDYGYSLVLRLHGLGLTELTEGTVYPALSRLKTRGLLGSRLVPSASGPAHKYYELTAAGVEELVRGVSAWTSLAETVHSALSPARSPRS